MNFKNDLEKKAFISSIVCAIITIGLGSLLHFTYDLTGENSIVGLFSAVNESIWEHLKLIFIPFLLTTVVENVIFGKHFGNFFFSRIVGIIAGMFVIVSGFYTYSGIIGDHFAVVDIILFVIGVIVSYGLSYLMMIKHEKKKWDNVLEIFSIFIMALICAMFFAFTYKPLELGIFESPPKIR